MKTLRNLTVSLLLALAAFGFNPIVTRAEEAPESPGPGCLWAIGGFNGSCWIGAYSCRWESQHCDYLYEYCNGSWSQVGDPNCTPLMM
jgi:hypothetical protein